MTAIWCSVLWFSRQETCPPTPALSVSHSTSVMKVPTSPPCWTSYPLTGTSFCRTRPCHSPWTTAVRWEPWLGSRNASRGGQDPRAPSLNSRGSHGEVPALYVSDSITRQVPHTDPELALFCSSGVTPAYTRIHLISLSWLIWLAPQHTVTAFRNCRAGRYSS